MSKAGRTEFGDLDEFLGHNPTSRSGGFLSGWKKDGSVAVFLHRKKLPVAVWRHPIPTIVAIEDKDTKKSEKRVFSKEYTCHEHEELLAKQYYRDDDGDREFPPKKCGACKMIDWFHAQCMEYERTRDEKKPKGISWTTPVFRFEGDREDETKVLHAGGLCGLFGQRDMTDEQKKELKDAKINLKEDWNQNLHAKMKYAMVIVNADAVDEGLQTALESKALGDAVKAEIKKAIKSLGRDEGNPQIKPYAIEWEYDKNESFSKMYSATRLERVKCTPAIMKLISGPPPDLSNIVTPFNQKQLRSMLERACLIKGVPWDDFFPDEDDDDADESDDESGDDGDADEKSDADETAAEEEEEFECDDCHKPSPASAKKCPHCGVKFDVDDDDETEPEPEPEPEQKPRKRSEAKAEKDKAASGGVGSKKSAKKGGAKKVDDDDDEDGIPF